MSVIIVLCYYKPIFRKQAVSEDGTFLMQTIWGTYWSLPSAGPAFRTSEMAIAGSPLVKCGLSLPPLTAIPNPYPGTRVRVTWWYSQTIRSPPWNTKYEMYEERNIRRFRKCSFITGPIQMVLPFHPPRSNSLNVMIQGTVFMRN